MIGKKFILLTATITSVITYSFWFLLPKGGYYVGNSLFIMLLSIYIFLTDKNLLTFCLISYAANNLFDELFFNPKELGINEVVFALLIPIIYYVKRKR